MPKVKFTRYSTAERKARRAAKRKPRPRARPKTKDWTQAQKDRFENHFMRMKEAQPYYSDSEIAAISRAIVNKRINYNGEDKTYRGGHAA